MYRNTERIKIKNKNIQHRILEYKNISKITWEIINANKFYVPKIHHKIHIIYIKNIK